MWCMYYLFRTLYNFPVFGGIPLSFYYWFLVWFYYGQRTTCTFFWSFILWPKIWLILANVHECLKKKVYNCNSWLTLRNLVYIIFNIIISIIILSLTLLNKNHPVCNESSITTIAPSTAQKPSLSCWNSDSPIQPSSPPLPWLPASPCFRAQQSRPYPLWTPSALHSASDSSCGALLTTWMSFPLLGFWHPTPGCLFTVVCSLPFSALTGTSRPLPCVDCLLAHRRLWHSTSLPFLRIILLSLPGLWCCTQGCPLYVTPSSSSLGSDSLLQLSPLCACSLHSLWTPLYQHPLPTLA